MLYCFVPRSSPLKKAMLADIGQHKKNMGTARDTLQQKLDADEVHPNIRNVLVLVASNIAIMLIISVITSSA